jgi:hypothetical protein
MQELDFKNKARYENALISDNIRFFNLYERAARILIHEYSPDKFTRFGPSTSQQAHILIAGFGSLGQALLLQAGKLYHFAGRTKLRATVIHNDGTAVTGFLRTYPAIEEVADVHFAEQKDVNIRNLREHTGNKDVHVIFICSENDSFALDIYNMLNVLISSARMVICQEKDRGFLRRIKHANVSHFDIDEETLNISSIVKDDLDAQAIQVHHSYQLKESDNLDEKVKELKKLTRQDWDKLPERTKNQNRGQADHIPVKLRTAGFQIAAMVGDEKPGDLDVNADMLELLAEMEHRRWNAEQLLNGWIHGKKRNNELKIHDNIVPYEELSEEIKKYDRDAVLNIPVILAAVGLKVIKL